VVRDQAASELHEGDEVPYARAAQEDHPRPRGFLRALRLSHGVGGVCKGGDGVRRWLLAVVRVRCVQAGCVRQWVIKVL
jgi:hypothetical protein